MVLAYCEHCMQIRNFIIIDGIAYCDGCDDIEKAITLLNEKRGWKHGKKY